MRDDIQKIVALIRSGMEVSLRSATDEEYVEAMEELADICQAKADAKREEMRNREQS